MEDILNEQEIKKPEVNTTEWPSTVNNHAGETLEQAQAAYDKEVASINLARERLFLEGVTPETEGDYHNLQELRKRIAAAREASRQDISN